jgi:hypothetical protein
MATSARGPLQASVYAGKGTGVSVRRFRNGNLYRFAVISYDHAGNRSAGALVVIRPSALLRSPRDGATVRTPPLLSWAPVGGATYYNVQLYRGSQKVLSAWPRRPKLRLERAWSYQHAQRLKKGRYHWYVWPAFGSRSHSRYGQVLGQSSFVVA